jgi:hypothetical protein
LLHGTPRGGIPTDLSLHIAAGADDVEAFVANDAEDAGKDVVERTVL